MGGEELAEGGEEGEEAAEEGGEEEDEDQDEKEEEMTPEAIMKDYDTDKDGKLSLTELLADEKDQDKKFPEIIEKAFGAADKNADSFIDVAELPEFNTVFDKENVAEEVEEVDKEDWPKNKEKKSTTRARPNRRRSRRRRSRERRR